MGNVTAVCYKCLSWEEVVDKADDAFFWQPQGALDLQLWSSWGTWATAIPAVGTRHPKYEQSRIFLGSAALSILTYAMNQWGEVLCWTQSLKTRNGNCKCKGWEEPGLWLDGACEPEKRKTKQKVGSTINFRSADFGLFRNLLGRLMEYSPEENDPGEVVSFQGLPSWVSRMVCSNSWGKKQREQECWQNWAINRNIHEEGEAVWKDYTDATQTIVHGPKKDLFTIDYLNNLKTKTKCHALENSSQSTASSEKVLS